MSILLLYARYIYVDTLVTGGNWLGSKGVDHYHLIYLYENFIHRMRETNVILKYRDIKLFLDNEFRFYIMRIILQKCTRIIKVFTASLRKFIILFKEGARCEKILFLTRWSARYEMR